MVTGIKTSFKISYPTLNLTYTPDLNSNVSSQFQRHARLFCNDVSKHKGSFKIELLTFILTLIIINQ